MNITLAISTSTAKFEVILSSGKEVLFNSKADPVLAPDRNLSHLLTTGLTRLELTPAQINNIVVDIGPGGTSAVRTGVAFANGLSYSLNVPVFSVTSMELMGFQAWEAKQAPVLCLVKSVKDYAYVGFYNDGKIDMKYGKIEKVVRLMTEGVDHFSLAGVFAAEIVAMLPEKSLLESAVLAPSMEFFIQNQAYSNRESIIFPNFALPITEQVLECYE